MSVLRYLAAVFVDTFGITHPTGEERDRAARFIALMLAGVFATLAGIILFAVHAIRR